MRRLAKKYPHYGFDVHKGYGTAVHLRAIKKHGSCDVHRLTFLGKRPKINK
jgi:ribonuclease HII